MSTYLVLFLLVAAIITIAFITAALVEAKSSHSDGFSYFLAALWSIIVVIIVGGSGSGKIAENEYNDRIQEKYDINIITSFDTDDHKYAIYAEGDCVARKAPNDVLYQIGCIEGSFVEVGE